MSARLSALLVALTLTGLIIRYASVPPTVKSDPPQRRPADDVAFEERETAKLLGVPLQKFPPPQGLKGMNEIPRTAAPFKFTLTSRSASGPPPRESYHERKIVSARARDGSTYEAYCGRDSDDSSQVAPGHGFVSTFENRRQWYATHHGYGFMPADVYIGTREAGRIKPTLFFRDVGSHETAPHYLAIDNRGMVHLAVADVNISQGNRLDMYWAIGDPKTGKWNKAWLIDRRGFTSWSHPRSSAWGDKVHLLWDWCDVSINKNAPGMGAYHVEWSLKGFGRKTRVFTSPVSKHDAAIDPRSGLLVIVIAKDSGGVYALSRSAEGKWTRPTLLVPKISALDGVSIEAAANGAFIVRAGSENTKEWLLWPVD